MKRVNFTSTLYCGIVIACWWASQTVLAETVFFEAESMQTSSDGWRVTTNEQTQRASRVKSLWG